MPVTPFLISDRLFGSIRGVRALSQTRRRRLRSEKVLDWLRRFESPNVTFIEPDGSWPIVWDRARGVHVWDAEGTRYLDLTAAFGVAAAGHANPAVVRAGQQQMAKLLHAMGDVHPHALKARLARELSRLTFERWGITSAAGRPKSIKQAEVREDRHRAKTIFCNSGFEAVEAALKTARLATGKPGIVAFHGGYHGLGYGALNATHRAHFRGPFRDQLRQFGHFVPFPAANEQTSVSTRQVGAQIERLFRRKRIGAILIEPIQVRGGLNLPAPGFLKLLRRLCSEHGALLVLDEIYTGFGRTGRWFACEHFDVVPDVICLGKALTGGFPLSACVGSAHIMDAAWPPSRGEAIHTSTFLGHPVGCAMALAQLEQIRSRALIGRSADLGRFLLKELWQLERPRARFRVFTRGLGLLAGLELQHTDGSPATTVALAVVKELLHRGIIILPEGEFSNVLGFTPPLTITQRQLRRAVRVLSDVLERRSAEA